MNTTASDMFSVEVPKEVIISPEQNFLIGSIINNPSTNFFITGAAGTGKSTLLKEFRKRVKDTLVGGPTGIAALNIGGQTLHSLFGIPPRIVARGDVKLTKYDNVLLTFKKAACIIIDEISMVRADTLDFIDEFLRLHCDRDKPFGGKQMIFFGDLDQLPPVVTSDEADILYEMYDSPYFFSAKSLREGKFVVKVLRTIHRQKDPVFIDILNAIKRNTLTDEQLSIINSRVGQADDHAIYLVSTNGLADTINTTKLNKLKTPEFTYDAIVAGEFNQKMSVAPQQLRLKTGAAVVSMTNFQDAPIMNGTRGIVTKLEPDAIHVKFDGVDTVREMGRYTWENKKFRYDRIHESISEETKGEYSQFPLKLGFASTIHKSQGQSFDRIHIDFGVGAFAHGMSYVALSRCRTLNGITLTSQFKRSDIIVDQKVANFYKQFMDKYHV
jgi:ATP-dependent DNA helicase PIF1